MSTEEDFMDFKCPYCAETVSFPASEAGRLEECINCMETLLVPEAGTAVGRKLPLPVTAQRLILRRFEPGDWSALARLSADEGFLSCIEGLPDAHEDSVIQWLEQEGRARLTTPGQNFKLAIQLKESGELAGYVGVRLASRQQAALDINLHPNYQRKGLAMEALDALLGFCFETLKLHRVTASCDSANRPACRLFENVGMRREAEFLKDRVTPEGGWASTVWYGALEEEYLNADASAEAGSAGAGGQ